MPIIYMKHPIHGAKVATMELEAVYDEQNGWVRYNLDEAEPEAEIPAFLQEPMNELAVPKKGRRKTTEV